MSYDVDVLVVGGGPAGVIAAYTAAKAGNTVFLTDAKTHEEIGNKTCGDALDMKALNFLKKYLGLEPPTGDEYSDVVTELVIQTEKQEIGVSGEGFLVDRHIYGQRLLQQAEEVGVKVKPRLKALRAIVEDNYVVGAVFKNIQSGEEEELRAKVTIDCSGRNYIIRKTMPVDQFPMLEHHHESWEIVASYREIIKLKEQDHPYHTKIYLMYDELVPEPGYFWFFSKGPYALNAGIGWKLNIEGKGSNMRKIFKQVLHKHYPEGSYEVVDAGGYTIPTRYPILNAVANGFITAGDAAFHVDPFTAEGHGPALMAGYLAGKYAYEGIKEGDVSEKRLWGYNQEIFGPETFGVLHCKTQLFTELLTSVGIKGLDFVLGRKIMTTDEFGQLNKGIRPSYFAFFVKFLKMFPRYNYLFKLRKLANGISKVEKFFKEYPSSPEEYPAWESKFLPWFKKEITSWGNYK